MQQAAATQAARWGYDAIRDYSGQTLILAVREQAEDGTWNTRDARDRCFRLARLNRLYIAASPVMGFSYPDDPGRNVLQRGGRIVVARIWRSGTSRAKIKLRADHSTGSISFPCSPLAADVPFSPGCMVAPWDFRRSGPSWRVRTVGYAPG